MMIRALCFSLLLISVQGFSQRQLVVIGHDKVIAVFMEGELIDLKLRNGESRFEKIVELEEFSMITTGDTIMLNKIKKIKIRSLKSKDFSRGLGGLLFLSGLLYLGIDQLNSALGYNPPGLDPKVLTVSLSLMAVGTTIILLRPRYVRVDRGFVLRSVDYKSPFYLK